VPEDHQRNKSFRIKAILALILAGESIFFLPFVIPRIFRPTVLAVFEINNFQLGTFFSLYGFVALGSYIIGGPIADRFPPYKLMSFALIMTLLGGVVMILYPTADVLFCLYGFWGFTTVLLFWSSLLRTTRFIGGSKTQGLMFGILDGGRGLLAAVISSIGVWIFSFFITGDVAKLDAIDRQQAFFKMVLFFCGIVILAAFTIFFVLRSFDRKATTTKSKIEFQDILKVMKMPAAWFQAVIILCAYCGYKATDDYSLLAKDVLGYDEVKAAGVGTLTFWIRPLAAVGAGYIADRFSPSKMIIYAFVLMTFASAGLAISSSQQRVQLVFFAIISSAVAVYALRGLYFAIMEESKIPITITGAVVGFVSVIGYMPDIFFGPLMGVLLDRSPGALGHQHLFTMLTGISVVGLVASLFFRRYIYRQ